MTYHEQIRKKLLEEIAQMQPGERIPNELHLAEFFGVSRMTVNKVITELAKEGYLTRGRGKGSFVSRKPASRKIVSILLPGTNMISFDLQHIITGATEYARKIGIGIELITVSPGNTKDLIDFSAIDHFSEESNVIVASNWFYRVFPFLVERNCNVLLIDRQLLQFAPPTQDISNFQILDCDIQKMIHDTFQRLYDRGCRKIAFRGQDPVLKSITCHYYEMELERRKMKGLLLGHNGVHPRLTEAELDSLNRFQADGLILDEPFISALMGADFHSVANIPRALPLELVRFNPAVHFLEKNPSSSAFNGERIGAAAVQMLMDPAQQKYRKLDPEYYPESDSFNQTNREIFQIL